MKGRKQITPVCSAVLMAVGIFLAGCSGSGGGGGMQVAAPSILNINSSTMPTSPVNLPIEINGSSFQAAPGKVVFTQGNLSVSVVPIASAWSDTGIVAVVPAGDGTTNFTLPGMVSVTVVTSGGTSNAVTLNLIQTLNFQVNNLTWTTTTPLPLATFPVGVSGLRAVAVQGNSSTTALVVVTGGFNGTVNTNTVLSNTLAADGSVGPSWTTANALPETRAHHAMAVADPTNSLVAANARFVYVIGGQKASTDTPGGTNTVFMASVDPTAGTVGTWQPLASTLPQPLLGMSATVYNGFLYVAGGLNNNGVQSAVYSAPIKTDGTLGAWTTAANALPTLATAAFAEMFAFGGKLYFMNGDTSSSTPPNNQGIGNTDVQFSNVSRGVVGTWTLNPNLTIKKRAKGILWSAFGQVIVGEGIYDGSPGSTEFEHSTVKPDGTLDVWTGLTNVNAPSANVYNAAAFVSPLISPAQTPRFLLLGGQVFIGTTGPGGVLSRTVFVNKTP